ncbi:MAG TPA: peptidoglycan-associated lipoprotein Pal [Terriglobales bacterium]|nr:peptidoglycan-associated lipoprotein Pal [Terriglobales bacterium]
MTRGKINLFPWIALLTTAFVLTGCSKKVAKATPPSPPPPPAAPTATLAAAPDVIQQGQTTTLTWQTQNANDITISGLGTIPASGSRSVMPNSSTTYTLTAKGPGGTLDASTRVTVNPVAKTMVQPTASEADLFGRNVKDVFFDFNKATIRPDEASIAQSDAQFLAQHPDMKIQIEGHCDDRGSEEYNLALGASRANSLKQALSSEGVSADRISTTSLGKEEPFCTSDDEQCWQQNRRDHFVYQR